MKAIRFQVPVKCQIPYTDTSKTYPDCGVLLLPENYSEDQPPARIVINCHGAGGTTTTDDSQTEQQTLTKYLLANGYAVMDVNGIPFDYAAEFGIDPRNNIGCNFAIDSYVTAYEYCVNHYNLKREVFVHGSSMGGISSTNLVLSKRIPVLAQSGFCPVLDTYNEIFLHPWSNGLPKIAMAKIYSFDIGSDGSYIYDEKKMSRFNPMTSDVIHPCPLLFCHCIDDDVVSPEITKQYIEKAKRQNCETKLVLLPGGGHEPQDYGNPVQNPAGNHKSANEPLNITAAIEEVFVWFEKHSANL